MKIRIKLSVWRYHNNIISKNSFIKLNKNMIVIHYF